jgi:hypothetical protein
LNGYHAPESALLVDDFAIPDHWPRAYAMDVRFQTGWPKLPIIPSVAFNFRSRIAHRPDNVVLTPARRLRACSRISAPT